MPYETWCVISIFRQINSFRKIRQIYKTFAFVHGCRHDSVTKLMIDRILSFLLTHVFNYIPPILQPTQHCDKWFIFHPSFILHHIMKWFLFVPTKDFCKCFHIWQVYLKGDALGILEKGIWSPDLWQPFNLENWQIQDNLGVWL